MAEPIYQNYCNFLSNSVNNKNLINFKNNRIYNEILEHTSFEQGVEYLNLITANSIAKDEVVNFCNLNDSIGNPVKLDFGGIISSPSNLRYIYHAHLILTHFKTFNMPVNIVEVGGGYGGLYLAICFFANKYSINIESYTIIDLPIVVKFQKLYLSNFSLKVPIDFIDSTTYGSDISKSNLFLISNYCFSEISMEHQKKYIEILFPKINHGFFAWNSIPVYNFGFNYSEEEEVPKTGLYNKYIRF